MARNPFDRAFREMEAAFDQLRRAAGGDTTAGTPIDVRAEDGHIVVAADLPGVEKDQIDVRVTADTVSIAAEDVQEVAHEEEQYYRHERNQRQFRRQVRLPVRVDPDSAEATYEHGVLTVRIARADGDGRQVDVS